ncbi:MAG: hypothetical protein ACXVGE_22435 [Blastococcus sp.]
MSVVSFDEVKVHLQMDLARTQNDAELQRFINAAEAAVARHIGPLVPTVFTESYDGGRATILLRQPNASAVTAITYGDGSTVTATDLAVDPSSGLLYWKYGTYGTFLGGKRYVSITYTAGYATLPDDVDEGIKELVRHLWLTQRGNNSSRPGFQDEPPVAGSYATWPDRVRELLDPYHSPRVA